MSVPRFPQRLFTKGEEPEPDKSVGYYSGNTKLFAAMIRSLLPDELDEIRRSSLGVFLKFHEMDFGWASRLVYRMLSFQIVCHKPNEIWSLIGVEPIRFSLHEFEHITCLKCDYVENLGEPDVEVTEEMKIFWALLGVSIKKGPTVDELAAAFDVCDDWSRENRLRLGYLSLYAGYIEGRRSSVSIPLNMAMLVMDLDAFLSYPWGRLAFKNLITSVKNKEKQKELCKSSYYVCGFVQAIQLWVYYALPVFTSEFGQPIRNVDPVPLMLSFQGSKFRKGVRDNMAAQVDFSL